MKNKYMKNKKKNKKGTSAKSLKKERKSDSLYEIKKIKLIVTHNEFGEIAKREKINDVTLRYVRYVTRHWMLSSSSLCCIIINRIGT